jgi:pyridoxine/pyridoxamine 5'-phosphate oxidase
MIITEPTTLSELQDKIYGLLNAAVNERSHPFSYCSLATAGDHELAIRYVVLRSVNDQLHLFLYSDTRTEKIRDININHQVALLFYDPKERFQLRISGRAKVHYEDDFCKEIWLSMPAENKREYLSNISSGEVIECPLDGHSWMNEDCMDHFAVIEIVPHKLDALQLVKTGHRRAQFHRDHDDWSKTWVAP